MDIDNTAAAMEFDHPAPSAASGATTIVQMNFLSFVICLFLIFACCPSVRPTPDTLERIGQMVKDFVHNTCEVAAEILFNNLRQIHKYIIDINLYNLEIVHYRISKSNGILLPAIQKWLGIFFDGLCHYVGRFFFGVKDFFSSTPIPTSTPQASLSDDLVQQLLSLIQDMRAEFSPTPPPPPQPTLSIDDFQKILSSIHDMRTDFDCLRTDVTATKNGMESANRKMDKARRDSGKTIVRLEDMEQKLQDIENNVTAVRKAVAESVPTPPRQAPRFKVRTIHEREREFQLRALRPLVPMKSYNEEVLGDVVPRQMPVVKSKIESFDLPEPSSPCPPQPSTFSPPPPVKSSSPEIKLIAASEAAPPFVEAPVAESPVMESPVAEAPTAIEVIPPSSPETKLVAESEAECPIAPIVADGTATEKPQPTRLEIGSVVETDTEPGAKSEAESKVEPEAGAPVAEVPAVVEAPSPPSQELETTEPEAEPPVAEVPTPIEAPQPSSPDIKSIAEPEAEPDAEPVAEPEAGFTAEAPIDSEAPRQLSLEITLVTKPEAKPPVAEPATAIEAPPTLQPDSFAGYRESSAAVEDSEIAEQTELQEEVEDGEQIDRVDDTNRIDELAAPLQIVHLSDPPLPPPSLPAENLGEAPSLEPTNTEAEMVDADDFDELFEGRLPDYEDQPLDNNAHPDADLMADVTVEPTQDEEMLPAETGVESVALFDDPASFSPPTDPDQMSKDDSPMTDTENPTDPLITTAIASEPTRTQMELDQEQSEATGNAIQQTAEQGSRAENESKKAGESRAQIEQGPISYGSVMQRFLQEQQEKAARAGYSSAAEMYERTADDHYEAKAPRYEETSSEKSDRDPSPSVTRNPVDRECESISPGVDAPFGGFENLQTATSTQSMGSSYNPYNPLGSQAVSNPPPRAAYQFVSQMSEDWEGAKTMAPETTREASQPGANDQVFEFGAGTKADKWLTDAQTLGVEAVLRELRPPTPTFQDNQTPQELVDTETEANLRWLQQHQPPPQQEPVSSSVYSEQMLMDTMQAPREAYEPLTLDPQPQSFGTQGLASLMGAEMYQKYLSDLNQHQAFKPAQSSPHAEPMGTAETKAQVPFESPFQGEGFTYGLENPPVALFDQVWKESNQEFGVSEQQEDGGAAERNEWGDAPSVNPPKHRRVWQAESKKWI